jgi:hypothetical protein
MGIVNLVDLADLSFTVLAGISPNVGTLSNVRDKNNSTSYGYVLDCGNSLVLVCMSCGASYRYVFTFNKPYFVTSIVINQLLNCKTSSSINSTFSFNNGNSDIVLPTISLNSDNTYSINSSVKSLTVNQTIYNSNNQLQNVIIKLNEVSIYGPDIPISKTRAYKDGVTYSLGKDINDVSPLYIGGERIAIGATNDAMATPLRFYWDGDTYSILRAQGV